MAEDTDYDEVVEGTVDEVKEAVREGLDPGKVLQAEKDNKERKTLVGWLEDQVEEGPADITPERESSAASVRELAGWRFAAGLVVGLVVAFALFSWFSPGLGGGLSPSAAGDEIETYFSENSEGIPMEGVRVESAERLEGSDLYRLDMVISASFLNRTVEQNQTAVVTSNARYMFLSQPIDTSRPLAEQIGTTGQAPTQ